MGLPVNHCTGAVEQRHPEQMIGVGERMAIRGKIRRVPQAAEAMSHSRGVPGKRPRAQHRIAEVAWKMRGDAAARADTSSLWRDTRSQETAVASVRVDIAEQVETNLGVRVSRLRT